MDSAEFVTLGGFFLTVILGLLSQVGKRSESRQQELARRALELDSAVKRYKEMAQEERESGERWRLRYIEADERSDEESARADKVEEQLHRLRQDWNALAEWQRDQIVRAARRDGVSETDLPALDG